jgi:hypothetical protein
MPDFGPFARNAKAGRDGLWPIVSVVNVVAIRITGIAWT